MTSYEKSIQTQVLANKIIKVLIDADVNLSLKLKVLKLAKEKVEFCKKDGADINQRKLQL